VNPQWLNVA
jgi:hypothetical protein